MLTSEIKLVIEHMVYDTVKCSHIHRFTCVVEVGGMKIRTNAISKSSARKLQKLGVKMIYLPRRNA